ncbi:hypothetical protein DFJ68_1028 [Terracoccus luteus]|uniref:PknH-like protein n=1 Tax=Terracoccus luteus TaxID=53356 RepID=A0A495XXN0_9MICO|nr:hypothetical protein [Terracoccus luteus]RKT77604.1 hypothetical protein DFJ68_1028 [Terracoccus luteus]
MSALVLVAACTGTTQRTSTIASGGPTAPAASAGLTSASRQVSTPPSAGAAPSPGIAPKRSAAASEPTPTASGFTPVAEAVTCVLERPSDPLVTVGELWPGVLRGGAGTRGLVRFDGPGCSDPAPVADSCTGALPWRPLSGRVLVLRSRAQRWLEGRVVADLPAGAVGAQADDTSLDYSALLYGSASASASGTVAPETLRALEAAAVSCLGAREGRVGGRPALVGSVLSVREPGTRAVVALVRSPRAVVTLRFDGGGWDAAERNRVAAAVLPRLLTP